MTMLRRPDLPTSPSRPSVPSTPVGRRTRLDVLVPSLLQFVATLVLLGAGAVLFRVIAPHGQPAAALVAAWAASTCTVLWLMRRVLERAADRIRFGTDSSYHSMRVLLRQMATALPIDEVVPRLAESLGRSAHAARTEVRIALDGDERWTQVWPRAAPPTESLTMQIRHLGASVGEVVFDSDAGAGDGRRQLEHLTGPAGLAMSTVKQTWELRRRVADLELSNDRLRESQARLRVARSTEQVRLQVEVDAQVLPAVRCAAVIVAALTTAPADAPPSQAALSEASMHLASALDRLRSIARGIYPPRLDEDGLPASLRSWADLAGEHVKIDATGRPAGLDTDAELQTCLYFCIVTILRAVTSTADSGPRVRLRLDADRVDFDIVLPPGDLAEPARIAVRDRLEAFGGELHIVGPVGGPTSLSGTVPLTHGSPERSTPAEPADPAEPPSAGVPGAGAG